MMDKESYNMAHHIYVEDQPQPVGSLAVFDKEDTIPESIFSSAGNSPPKVQNMFNSSTKMGVMLETQQALQPVKTIRAFKIKPNIIYIKNSRD